MGLPAHVATAAEMGEQLAAWRADERGAVGGLGLSGGPWREKVASAAGAAEGMPIGVQIVALPWQEEVCLRAMKELETALGPITPAVPPGSGQ